MGGTVLLVGLAMMVLPGPAVVVIPAGLAILATEFVWARKLLQRAKNYTANAATKTGLFCRPEAKRKTASQKRGVNSNKQQTDQ